MKRSTNIWFQGIATALNVASQFTGLIPPKALPIVTAAISLGQATVGLIAHSYNTDGTPQEVPFVSPSLEQR